MYTFTSVNMIGQKSKNVVIFASLIKTPLYTSKFTSKLVWDSVVHPQSQQDRSNGSGSGRYMLYWDLVGLS